MTQDIYSKEYHAQRELKSCGLQPESIDAIKNTTVITKNGAQHVVPSSQQHLDEAQQGSNSTSNPQASQDIALLQKQFSRYKNYADQRITKLEQTMSQATTIIKELQQTVMTLKSNAQAQGKRDEVQEKTQSKAPEKKGIDRNNVAPADVQVDQIFYCGTR